MACGAPKGELEALGGYQPKKPKKVYCEYCKYFEHIHKEICMFKKEYYNCLLYTYYTMNGKFPIGRPTQIFDPRGKEKIVQNGALEKNKNNNCPDYKPKLKYKLLGKG